MRIRTIGDITILHLTGRIGTNDGAEEVLSEVQELLQLGHSNLLVNLGRVASLDYAGIEALVVSYDLALRSGGQLKFVCPGNGVLHLLDTTRLLMGTDVHPTVGKAFASFS